MKNSFVILSLFLFCIDAFSFNSSTKVKYIESGQDVSYYAQLENESIYITQCIGKRNIFSVKVKKKNDHYGIKKVLKPIDKANLIGKKFNIKRVVTLTDTPMFIGRYLIIESSEDATKIYAIDVNKNNDTYGYTSNFMVDYISELEESLVGKTLLPLIPTLDYGFNKTTCVSINWFPGNLNDMFQFYPELKKTKVSCLENINNKQIIPITSFNLESELERQILDKNKILNGSWRWVGNNVTYKAGELFTFTEARKNSLNQISYDFIRERTGLKCQLVERELDDLLCESNYQVKIDSITSVYKDSVLYLNTIYKDPRTGDFIDIWRPILFKNAVYSKSKPSINFIQDHIEINVKLKEPYRKIIGLDITFSDLISEKEFKVREETANKLAQEQKIKDEQRRIDLIKRFGRKYGNLIAKGHYQLGMNKEMIIELFGEPKHINTTINSFGTTEQWAYENEFLYFDNYGKLESVQTYD